MTPSTPGSPAPALPASTRRRGRSVLIVAAVLVGIAGGLYVGARWHASIAPRLGIKATGDTHAHGDKGGAGSAAQLWTCGMHPQVIQDKPGDCPICHMKLTPLKMNGSTAGVGSAQGSAPAGTRERKIKYWWDPMLNPPYISDKPGKSPMGMDLIPVYEDEAAGAAPIAGTVTIDPAVVQNMGVRSALVTEGPLARPVRLVGYLEEAQPNTHDINLRVSGWIRKLYAATEGLHVEAGDPLFDLYSPELQLAIEELISSRRGRSANPVGAGGGGADGGESLRMVSETLYDAAASKLELLGLERAQIDALAKLDRAPGVITFTSPITGHITEKPIVEGSAVKTGDRALRIVDHTMLWLDAQVFEKDLPFVKVGQEVTATVADGTGSVVKGKVVFIHPHLNMMTRTALVRLEVPNPALTLRPGMYATVRAESLVADRAVLVPREAVIDTGESQVVFVPRGAGQFEPRKVRMGLFAADGLVQVVEGLSPGETVITSGHFLLDSESRLREAIQKFLSEKKQAASNPPPSATAPAAGSTAVATSPMFEATPAQAEKVDAVVGAYLTISDALGAVQRDASTPPQLDMTKLISAAHALHGEVSGTRIEPLAVGVAKAAEAMKGQNLDNQRQRFSALGEKVIALVDALPPSAAAAKTLYVMNCPMAPGGAKGDWLQTSPDVANPFFATDMKQCGQRVRTIRTREGR